MSLCVFQHAPHECSSRLGRILQEHGHRLVPIALHEGQNLPTDLDGIDGIIIMGGPMNVADAPSLPWMGQELALIKQAHHSALPMVGVCLGAQLIAAALGGQVDAIPTPPGPEVGWQPVRLSFPGTIDPVLAGIPWNTFQFHCHGQQVTQLPPNATHLASSRNCQNQVFRVGLTTYAFQYHFEWTLADIQQISQNDQLFASAKFSPQEIAAQSVNYYDLYRHLGDRLAQTIAKLLFPIGKQ